MEIKNIVIETQNILDESSKMVLDINKKYYNDVLDFMNLLFDDNSKIISKIKFKKVTLNDKVFALYNQIIKKYKLNKPEFDETKFDLDEIKDLPEIKKIFIDLALKLSNNLLEKIDYKLKIKYYKNENIYKFILEYFR